MSENNFEFVKLRVVVTGGSHRFSSGKTFIKKLVRTLFTYARVLTLSRTCVHTVIQKVQFRCPHLCLCLHMCLCMYECRRLCMYVCMTCAHSRKHYQAFSVTLPRAHSLSFPTLFTRSRKDTGANALQIESQIQTYETGDHDLQEVNMCKFVYEAVCCHRRLLAGPKVRTRRDTHTDTDTDRHRHTQTRTHTHTHAHTQTITRTQGKSGPKRGGVNCKGRD